MALNWIKYTTTLHDCPEVVQMAETLKTDVYSVTGRLMKVWTWATDHTTDGNARGVTRSFIDRHVEMPGFADAMVSVGWLVVNDKGVTFPRFDTHLSNGAKARAMTQKRVSASRSRNAATVTESLPDKTREDKTREQDKQQQQPKTWAGPHRFHPDPAAVVVLCQFGMEERTAKNVCAYIDAAEVDRAVRYCRKNGLRPGFIVARVSQGEARPWNTQDAQEASIAAAVASVPASAFVHAKEKSHV